MNELYTERLIIRKFSPDDWKDLYDYLSDPLVIKYEPYGVFSEEECTFQNIFCNVHSYLSSIIKNNFKIFNLT